MIRNIFVPHVLGSYYIFAQKIVGFDIGKTFVQATVVKAYRNKRTIENFIQERISDESGLDYTERVSKAIVKILDSIGKYDLVYTSMSSAQVIFKELTVPFTQIDKIKMVLPYEVEPLLPFSLDTAVVDCILTKTDKAAHSSDLLVAAVKQETLAQHVQFFEAAGVHPKKISIDLFELYSLYESIPAYAQLQGIAILVDIGFYATRIAIILDGQLKHIRSLARGVIALAQDNHEQGLVFEKDKLQQFMSDIQFTLQAYKERAKEEQPSKIIITGHGSEIQGLVEVLESVCHHECELFHPSKILKNENIALLHGQTIPQSFVVSLSTALSLTRTQHFNLQHVVSNVEDEKLFDKQLIAAAVLCILIIGGLIFDNWRTKRAFQKEIEYSNQDALKKLKAEFDKVRQAKGTSNLTRANTIAEEEVKKEEAILSQLLRKDKISFLSYLEELSQRIDRDALGLQLNKLALNETTRQIDLEGKVRDYKELALLEQSLRRSKMFKFLTPKLQETTFEIKLGVNEDYGKE